MKKTFKQLKEEIWNDPDWRDYILGHCLNWFEHLRKCDLTLLQIKYKMSWGKYQEIVNKNTIIKILKGELTLKKENGFYE
jgi:hypothetical protein